MISFKAWKRVGLMVLNIFSVYHCMEYSELRKLGVSCSPYDTCSREPPLGYLNICSCDPSCALSSNCCIDSPYAPEVLTPVDVPCLTVTHGERINVLMISHCSNNWKGQKRVQKLCESPNLLLGDPIEIIPVTDIFNGITYKNYFCARCNRKHRNVMFWEMSVPAKHIRDPFEMEYRLKYKRAWDRRMYNVQSQINGGYISESTRLSVSVPERISRKVQICSFSPDRQCIPQWKDLLIKRKCQSYRSEIVVRLADGKIKFFSNIHCAICNNITASSVIGCNAIAGNVALSPINQIFGRDIQPMMGITELFGHETKRLLPGKHLVTYDPQCVKEKTKMIYIKHFDDCRKTVRPKK